LERLEKEYQESLNSLLRQKGDAKRWLLRQQIRLSAQCEEVRKEKAFIGDLLEEENRDFLAMQQAIKQVFLQKKQEQQQQQQSSNTITSSSQASRLRAFSQNDTDHLR
jgi:hypothetical protein